MLPTHFIDEKPVVVKRILYVFLTADVTMYVLIDVRRGVILYCEGACWYGLAPTHGRSDPDRTVPSLFCSVPSLESVRGSLIYESPCSCGGYVSVDEPNTAAP